MRSRAESLLATLRVTPTFYLSGRFIRHSPAETARTPRSGEPRIPVGKDPLPASARVFLRVELGIPAELVEAASVSFLVAVDVKRSEGEAGKKGDEGGRSVASAVAEAMAFLRNGGYGIPKHQLVALQERLGEEISRQMRAIKVERSPEESLRSSLQKKTGSHAVPC